MQKLASLLAAVLVAFALTAPAAAYPAADCAFYETAYAAVVPELDEARMRDKGQSFATLALDRPHDAQHGRAKPLDGPVGPIVDLSGCRALLADIEAHGAPVKFGRPPVLRQVDGPLVESFSRPVTLGGVIHVTYFIGRDSGVDVTLRAEPGGGWSVVAAVPWETLVVT